MAVEKSPAPIHGQKVRSWARSPGQDQGDRGQTMAPRTAAQATASTARRGRKRPSDGVDDDAAQGQEQQEQENGFHFTFAGAALEPPA